MLFLTVRRAVRTSILLTGLLVSSHAFAADYLRHMLADGFDFAVGKPNSKGYYIYRGYWPNGHLGEDWNGRGGGNSDLGDPIYSIAHGVVVLSENRGGGWGNVIIIRHAYRESNGKIRYADSLYGHLLKRHVRLHQKVMRGQQIGTLGTGNGVWTAHLHLEMRHNLSLGMERSAYPRDNRCYYSPRKFIQARRRLRSDSKLYPIPVNTFKGQGSSEDPRKNLRVPLAKNGYSSSKRRRGSLTDNDEVNRILDDIRENKKEKSKGLEPLRFWDLFRSKKDKEKKR